MKKWTKILLIIVIVILLLFMGMSYFIGMQVFMGSTQLVTCEDRLTESGVELRLREMGKKLGVEKVHPHKFRRTMATRAIEKGMPIEQVQKILGHEQIDTTFRYAMVNQNNVKLSHRKYIS